MRISFRDRHHDDNEYGLIFSGIAVAAMVALRVLPVAHVLPGCVFREVTAMPCPTCGGTRSALFLVHGELFASLGMNPLAALFLVSACIVFFISMVAYLLHFPRAVMTFTAHEHQRMRVVIAVLVLVNWAYLICTLPCSS